MISSSTLLTEFRSYFKREIYHIYCNIAVFCAVKSLRHRGIALKNKQDDVTSEVNVDLSLEPRNLVNVFNRKAFCLPKRNTVYIFIYIDPFILYKNK